MPSNKPRIQIILEQEYYEKYKYLREKENRSDSNLGKYIIQNYIDQYEKIHGIINIEK